MSHNSKMAAQAAVRAGTKQPPKHGMNGYVYWGCRCDVCVEAARERATQQRARRKMRAREEWERNLSFPEA